MQFKDVRSFLGSILSEDTHAKRVDSLANAALGVMTGASLAVAMIGKSLYNKSVYKNSLKGLYCLPNNTVLLWAHLSARGPHRLCATFRPTLCRMQLQGFLPEVGKNSSIKIGIFIKSFFHIDFGTRWSI